jgi:PhnB protein
MNPKPYIFFNGTARAAIAGHVKVFNSPEPEIMTMGSVPHDGMDIPADRLDWVMHCKLAIGDGSIMICDDFMGNNPDMAGSSIVVNFSTEAEGRAVFAPLAEGGEIHMAWMPTFWAAGFGQLSERWGTRWMIGTDAAPSSS